jgi:hypothetical protein
MSIRLIKVAVMTDDETTIKVEEAVSDTVDIEVEKAARYDSRTRVILMDTIRVPEGMSTKTALSICQQVIVAGVKYANEAGRRLF